MGPAHRQVRLAQGRAAHGDGVGLPGAHDLLGLGGLRDEADRHDHRLAAPRRRRPGHGRPDLSGEGHLVAGPHGHARGRVRPGRDVQDVDARGHEQGRELGGVLAGQAALGPVGGRQADVQDRGVVNGLAHRPDGLEGEAAPAGWRAAELVVAGVGQGREELVDEVAVGPVELDDVVARRRGAARGVGEGGRRRGDLLPGERPRRGVAGVGDGAGRHQVPALDGGGAGPGGVVGAPRGSARLAAAVAELDAGQGAGGVNRLDDAAVAGDLGVVPQAQVGGGQAAVGGHRGGLHDHGAEAAGGAGGVVQDVPVGGDAVVGVDGVHAHGRQPQAIAGGAPAHGQGSQDGRHSRRGHETHVTCSLLPPSTPRPCAGAPVSATVRDHPARADPRR